MAVLAEVPRTLISHIADPVTEYETAHQKLQVRLHSFANNFLNGEQQKLERELYQLPQPARYWINRAHPNLDEDETIYIGQEVNPALHVKRFGYISFGWALPKQEHGMVSCLQLGYEYSDTDTRLDYYINKTLRTHQMTENGLNIYAPVDNQNPVKRRLVADYIKPEHQHIRIDFFDETLAYLGY